MSSEKHVLRAKRTATQQAAFVKRYDVANDFSFPAGFDLSKHSILGAESVRAASSTALFLYWSSAERARALEPKVIKDLGLSNASEVGDVVEIVTPKKPKLLENSAKWGQWLITAAAIFGALSAIQDHFTELFGRPHVVIFAGEKAPANIHFGDPIDLPIEFRNQARLGHVDVHIETVKFKSADPVAPAVLIQSPVSDLPQIQAGQNSEIHLLSMSPSVASSKPQHYTLSLEATAKGGYFWPRANVTSLPFDTTLWPDRIDEFQPRRVGPNAIQIDITVGSGIGMDKGLRGQLTFVSTAIPQAGGIVLTGGANTSENPIIVTSSSGSSAKLQFQTGSLQAFRRVSITVTVLFQAQLTEAQWNELKSSVKVVVA